MDALAQIGGTHIAAPPAGANRPGTTLDLDQAAERYHTILEIGRRIGVVPQLEVWGPSANLSSGSEALYVAAKADHPDACILLDGYHMDKGGTPPTVLKLLGRQGGGTPQHRIRQLPGQVGGAHQAYEVNHRGDLAGRGLLQGRTQRPPANLPECIEALDLLQWPLPPDPAGADEIGSKL